MNALQFYYVNTVLGVSSFIQPQIVRTTYQLIYGFTKEPDLLFFCDPLKTNNEYKTLIQKMAKALGSDKYIIVEILNSQSSYIPSMLKNLLTRFLPKGFVIFCPNLGAKLLKNIHTTNSKESSEKQPKKTDIKISIGNNQYQSVYGCILKPLNDFMGSDLKIHQNKKQAWNTLKEIYLS